MLMPPKFMPPTRRSPSHPVKATCLSSLWQCLKFSQTFLLQKIINNNYVCPFASWAVFEGWFRIYVEALWTQTLLLLIF